MRFKFISVFAFLAVLPGFAIGKLPMVDVAGGGVSARSAFGDTTTVRGAASGATVRNVVARKSVSGVAHNSKQTEVDVLSPNLPSSNLWAANQITPDAPLRMPMATEVAVLQNDFELPDENLDDSFALNNSAPITRGEVARELESTMNRMAQIDAQIARLAELQRRANDSVQDAPVSRGADNNVRVARTVVPMNEPDVLVRRVEKHTVPQAKKESPVMDSLAGLSPAELRQAFRKTFLSENKHLSAMSNSFADTGDTTLTTSMAGFSAESNLSEMDGAQIRPFEIKVSFRNFDSALSRDNYQLLTTFAGIVINDPKRAVQILIPKDATLDSGERKLTARRLAIIEQVLRDNGIPEQRILPVLSNRDDDGGLVLRNIDSTQYETLTKQQRDQFGKKTTKTYTSMTW